MLLVLLACTSPDEASGTGPGDSDGRATDSSRDSVDSGTDSSDSGDTDTSEPPVACDAVETWADGLVPSRELHVEAGARGGDGSEGSPYGTLEDAARDATPGTSIVLHAGTYAPDAWVEDLRGTATEPIWLGGAEGEEKPRFEGGSQAFHLVRPAWIVVHDIEASGSSANGINADDNGEYADEEAAHHVIFRDLDIHDIGGGGNEDCLKLSGLNDFHVLDSSFARCGGAGSGSGIDHVGCHRGLLARNQFTEMSGNAIQAKGGSDDLEIRSNHVQDGGERAFNLGGSTGPEYFRPPLSTEAPNFEARNLRVYANLIVGSVAPVAYVGCVECVVANNTIVDPTHWVARILQETTSGGGYDFEPARDGVFANNLVYYSLSDLSTHVNVGPDTDPGSFTFSNDLWYAHDQPGRSAPDNVPVTETNAVVGEDPAFVDGYTIDATSPAAGAGISVETAPGDFAGACWRDPPAIGAYEAP